MTDFALRSIAQRERDIYNEDGVVFIKDAFDRDTIERLRGATRRVMDNPRPSSKLQGSTSGGRFFTDVDMWKDDETFKEIAFGGFAPNLAAQLMGARKINLYNEHLLVKEPGSDDAPTPWHQDQPYFRTDGWQICSIWIAMDVVTEESGAMRFVKGSHKWGKMFQPKRFTSSESTEASAFDGPPPSDIDKDPERYPTICYELQPGDCTVHHGLTLHAANGNQSESVQRRALSLRYAGDDITYIERQWHPTESPPGMIDGQQLDSAAYPVVWRR